MIEGNCNIDYMKPNETGIQLIEDIRISAKKFEESIRALCPQSREASLALTNLEQSVMWATKAICIATKE